MTDPIDKMLETLGPIDIDLMSLPGVEAGIFDIFIACDTDNMFKIAPHQLVRLGKLNLPVEITISMS